MQLSPSSLSALLSLCKAQISPQLPNGSLLIYCRHHSVLCLTTSPWVSSTVLHFCSFLLTGVWLSTPRNLWINQHATGEERKGERWRMATGESVSISCRWTHDAVQLLLVLLLLWNRVAERRKRGKQSWKMRVPGGVSLREEKKPSAQKIRDAVLRIIREEELWERERHTV